MMAIHVKITIDLCGQVEKSMFGEAFQHVVEETDARLHIASAGTVYIQLQFNVRLFCVSLYHCCSWHTFLLFAFFR